MWSVELKNPAPAPEIFRRLRRRKGTFWLDGALGGRASFMAFAPVAQLWIDPEGHAHRSDSQGTRRERGDPIEALARFVEETPPFDGPPAAPRTVGYLSYELGPFLEPHLAARTGRDLGLPIAWLARYDAVVVCEPLGNDAAAPCRLVVRSTSREAGEPLLAALTEARASEPEASFPAARLIESPDWDEYRVAAGKALDYIAAGDVYQVNLTRRFRVSSGLPAPEAYLRLRAIQPVPFGAYLDCGDFALLSNSPERFIQIQGSSIRTEPIKGTHRRHPDAEIDQELAAQLRVDPKERAEHVMIVDLERNDIGRICQHGSVHVTSLLRLESFATLHHLVSTVEGQLRPEVGLADILRATFPGGSITGAPKIRASEVIAELERDGRGPYTGMLAWFRSAHDFDSSIAIRTAVAKDGVYTYHAGGGIVADSDPWREYRECWLKTKAFLYALLGPTTCDPLFAEGVGDPGGAPRDRATAIQPARSPD